jgi:hypothetical protein
MDELATLRQHWRVRRVTEGVLLALAATVAMLVVTVAADNLLKFGTTGRIVLAFLLWGTAIGSVAVLVIQRWLEDRRDDFFAAMVEEKHPELGNKFINALQLGRSNGYGSPRLVEAIVHDAAEATADLELLDCLDSRLVRRNAGLLAAAAALLVLYPIGFSAARFGNGLGRVLLPSASIAPYTATQVVEVTPGNKRFLEGTPITITAQVAGKLPRECRLNQRKPGGMWQRSVMGRVADSRDRFQFAIAAADESIEYFVEAGDGRSETYRVEVVERPEITGIVVDYELPAYTGLPPRRVEDSLGELHAIAGSVARLEFTANKPLQRAVLVAALSPALRAGSEPGNTDSSATEIASKRVFHANSGPRPGLIDCTRGSDDRHWLASLPIAGPGTYQVKATDTEGFEGPDPVRHSITLARDVAPAVTITSPGRDLPAKPDQVISLAVDAKDDYGLAELRLLFRVNDEQSVRELKTWPYPGAQTQVSEKLDWNLAEHGLKSGDLVQYWAAAADRNDVTGPGQSESRRYSIFIIQPEQLLAKLEIDLDNYAAVLEELLRLERKNRAETASGLPLDGLVTQQTVIRTRTRQLAAAMRKNAMPAETMIETLEELHAGAMADAIRLLESGRDTADAAKAKTLRDESLPVQDGIIRQLQDLLARLQRNEQAKQALKKLEKTDKPAQQAVTEALNEMIKDLDRFVSDEQEVAEKLEKMPKKPVDEFNQENADALKGLDEFAEKWGKWAKGKVDELTKLPTGFVDDFGLREDVNRIFEEVEMVAERPKSSKLEVAVEDLGAALATKMKEDLELWMPNAPDALKWVLEEPLTNKPMQIPEMPLPSELEDLIGELMQKAEEFDEEADDVTSAWGDNLDQAGWDVSDGPISSFSAKGKTGNDLPNTHEVSGRSGDGRRGKSSGQMVGDTARNLEGRDTPARLNNERYEPGNLKQEQPADPKGATGGGKKAGAGRRGLQGGTPPDFVRDMERLSEKQAGLRERAERVAQELDTRGITSRRLAESIQLMKSVETDLRDLRYEDAARKRRIAIHELKSSVSDLDKSTGLSLSRARDLPPDLREQILQSCDEGLPAGYESLVKSYFRALSEAEK